MISDTLGMFFILCCRYVSLRIYNDKTLIMEKTFQLMKNFERRNNISIAITFCSDGSSSTEEFWDNEKLNESNNIEELHQFLMNTQYKLDEVDGRCFSPVQIAE